MSPPTALWPSSEPALLTGIAHLPTVTDDTTAYVIEALMEAIVTGEEQTRALRDTLRAALGMAHEQVREIRRLKAQQTRLLAERQPARGRAA